MDLMALVRLIELDNENINKIFSKFNEAVNSIDQNCWNGDSKNNFVNKANEFVNSFGETIKSQMNSFAGAVAKFCEYKNYKKEKESIESLVAVTEDESEKNALQSKISTYSNQMSSLKSEIENLLSAIITSVKTGESVNNFANPYGLLGLVSTVGEAANIPKSKRMGYLFPDGVPTSKAEAEKYLTTITVKAYDGNGNARDLKITVHKKLAEEVKMVYDELYQIKFPVSDSGGYNYRNMTKSNKLSHHSYGVAIDLNASSNPFGGTNNKNSKFYNNDEVVAIWKKHGFYWGGDWNNSRNDPMHFTYTGY